MMFEILYCGDCHCNHSGGIKSNLCKKRFFDIELPHKIDPLRLVFCAEYLRTCVQDKMIKLDTSFLDASRIKFLLEDIIRPYLPGIVTNDKRKYSKINNIYFWVNKRLGIYSVYTFEEALEILMTNSEAKYSDLLSSVIFEIDNYCLSKQRYLKHKSRILKLKSLAKKLQNSNSENVGIICCEILSIILMSESEIKNQLTKNK